ncbi:MAG TPA: hypothetical protein VFH73_01265 [Polyangia bacterium]|jgi:hypothetical protein|nr:hypothetical protein [Polyangia bacterium]
MLQNQRRKEYSSHTCIAVFGVLVAGVVGCGELAEKGIVSPTGALSFENLPCQQQYWQDDGGRQCPVPGRSRPVHCCPDNFAMIGAHLGHNVFKCARVMGGLGPVRVDDGGTGSTQRNGMHACLKTEVMVGYYEGVSTIIAGARPEQLLCAKPNMGPDEKHVIEFVDRGDHAPSQFRGMHVCPMTMDDDKHTPIENPGHWAMSGIHASRNWFSCMQ